MKRILCALLMLCLMIPFVSCASDVSKEPTNFVKMTVSYTDANGKACRGDIIIELDPTQAPITVANFQKLVSEGVYNGLTFHRVISGFMIQGGDPKGDGTGGTDPIKGEFAENGVNNTIAHRRGVISMARTNDPDSGSSQFFIVHQTSANNTQSLDGKYAAFGYVIDGIEHVDGIAGTATNPYTDKPYKTAKIESAVFVNR